jgi:heparin/heparan-sulfate lyase
VLLRKSDIPSIKAKMNHPETVNVWKTILRNSESNTAGAKIGTIIGVYEANALLYVLQNDEQAGIKAKNLVMENIAYYDSIDDADSIEVGVFIGSLGIVYDWCHKFFSNDELQIVISTIKRIASKMESGYPPVKQSSITGHSSEYLIMRDLMMAGIAAYDEDPEIYNLAAGRFFDEHLPARNFFIRRERTIRVFLMGTTDTAAIYFLRLFSTEWDAAMFLIRHRVKFRTSGYICTGRTG